MSTIIYELERNGVYYVGLTDRKPGESPSFVVQRRLEQHWGGRWDGESPKQRWLQSLRQPPRYTILREVDDAVASVVERWTIQEYASRGYLLTNTTHNPYPYDVGPQRRLPWWMRTAARIVGRWMWRELRRAL